jgi:hypothetical protein
MEIGILQREQGDSRVKGEGGGEDLVGTPPYLFTHLRGPVLQTGLLSSV